MGQPENVIHKEDMKVTLQKSVFMESEVKRAGAAAGIHVHVLPPVVKICGLPLMQMGNTSRMFTHKIVFKL